MSYFVQAEGLSTAGKPRSIERLLVEVWINALQSKNAMLLGPQPFSILSLLESIRHVTHSGTLKGSTIALKLRAALAGLEHCAWIRRTYPAWPTLASALSSAADNWTRANRSSLLTALDDVISAFSAKRIVSHLNFILNLPDYEMQLGYDEVTDLLADLIALGHSESFLYGWGRAVLLAQEPSASAESALADRIARLGELGRLRTFWVAFKIRPASSWVPHSDRIFVGRKLRSTFKSELPFDYSTAETGALVKIEAPDYKAAIERAVGYFVHHTGNLRLTTRIRKIDLILDEFKLRCEDNGEERTIKGEVLRPYEPPPLTMGNALWILPPSATGLRNHLERALFWLAESRHLRGEAEFLALWLALCALFGTDKVEDLIAPLSRYRLAWSANVLATWITDFLGQAYQLRREMLPRRAINALKLPAKRQERLRCIVDTIRSNPSSVLSIAEDSPLLRLRVEELASLCDATARVKLLTKTANELETLLPWFQSLRHSVAHFGIAAVGTLELANRHLAEDVTIVFDQMAAAAVGEKSTTVQAIHRATLDNFDNLMAKVVDETCVLATHVRSGQCGLSVDRRDGTP